MRQLLTQIENWISIICLVCMTAIAFANVVARYVFSASFSFSEEITTYMFVILSLIGAAIAARRGAHLGFTAIFDIFSPKTKRFLASISALLGTVYSGAICYYGILMTISQYGRHQVTAGMQWPEWIFGSFVPIGAFFCTLEFAIVLKKHLAGEKVKKGEEA